MGNRSTLRKRSGFFRVTAVMALLVALAGCSTLTDLLPGASPSLEFVEPRAGSSFEAGESVPVRVSTDEVSAPLESVHLEVDGEWMGVLSDSDGDGEYTGSFTVGHVGSFRLMAVGVGEDGRIRTGAVDLVGEDQPGFSMVVIPDTQFMIEDPNNTMVQQMTDWIVERRDALDIEFVTHVGDVVQNGNVSQEWVRADSALDRLHGAIPYSVALGNHDYADTNDKSSSTENYRAYFGAQRYAGQSWYGGAGPGDINHYQVFQAGGRTFLHINLEWEPAGPVGDPSTPLGWAQQVINDHAGMPTIITTHAYLWDQPGQEGHFPGPEQGENAPGSTGVEVFEQLVSPNPQVFMVLNGHFHIGTDGQDGEYHQVSTNDAGLPVYEMLSDYQDYPEGGEGWLRLIQFIPGGGAGGQDRISVRTYSPVLNRYQSDDDSRFHFDLSFDQRLALD